MKNFRIVCLSFFMVLAGSPALAASITNLDTKPYDILVKMGGDQQVVHLEPNRTWTTESHYPRVRYRDHWMELDDDASYAIWKDGTLSRQSMGPKTRNGKGM